MGRAFSVPFDAAAALADRLAHRLSRHPWTRNIRAIVPVCVLLICASFAAATFLSMRMDRLHALNQAGLFEQARAQDIAAMAGAGLDRLAAAGVFYADHPGSEFTMPGLRN